jgi:hypothetical protein
MQACGLRGEAVTFDTWEEGTKRGIPEYHMVPSRSAAKAVVERDGKDCFAAMTCHLAGGKFDDRWLLTGESLCGISGLMLQKFGDSGAVPAVLFGDTNMKHHDFVDEGLYDSIIRGMLFGQKEVADITKLSPAYEGHKQYLLQGEGAAEKVTDIEKRALENSGKNLTDLASVYNIHDESGAVNQAAVETLAKRTKLLWRIDEVPGMVLIKPESSKATTCLFGGVIDHIFYKPECLTLLSHSIDENEKVMLLKPPEGKQIFDRIQASDHFPVYADFQLK